MRKFQFVILLVFAVLCISFAGCAPKEKGKIKLVVWGLQMSEESKGIEAAVAEFERRHPNIDVKVLSMGAGGMNPQKLMTAIVGKVPPDVIHQDRFTIGDWASRDTFMPLDGLIKRDLCRWERSKNKKGQIPPIRPEEFYKACWAEAVYKGKVYAIPFNTDDRALYYNRKLFREVGLDPDRPPKTWDELLVYAKKLTKYRKDGGFERIGFIPNFGNSWLYLYSWQNGGEFMSPDGRKCTMNNPRSVAALEYMVSVYDALKGVDAINSFSSGFKANELDPFLTGLVAMKIDGNWFTNNIARYAPDLDFAVAPAPVPRARYEGKPPFTGQPKFITWSGGFSLAIPRGAKHVEESWEFIKWMVSEEAQVIANEAQRKYNMSKGRPYVPWMTANSKVNEVIFTKFAPKQKKFRKATRVFLDLMAVSRYRPVTFVGQRLWDEHVRAFDYATHHKMSAQEAMDEGTKVVQKELDKVFNRSKYGLLNWAYPLSVVGIGVIILFVICFRKLRQYGPMGRLAKAETVAGYLFASPWIVGFLVFTIGPIIASIIFSFCDYDVLHPARWVGLLNYRELLIDDWSKYTSKALYNAGFLALFGLPLTLITGLAIAMLLNTKVGGMTWYRTIYYLPSIVPVVANAILWIWVLNPEYGLINAAWRATLGQWFALPAPLWLTHEKTAKPALILMGLWGAGGGMILWLAGLQGVPQHLYEAAEIDGANWWSKFWNVTFPMITPYLFFNLIMGTIGVLQTFETVYIMTGGGPVDSTLVPVLYLFNCAFTYFKMGYASALAWILFIIVLILTLVQLKLAPRWVHYEGERAK
ncbi:MAG: extracellular solute-binding protein [Armatimonadetes bacterium]|nr:extracellular solute-binding protein [Armatimonadota bacterium]